MGLIDLDNTSRKSYIDDLIFYGGEDFAKEILDHLVKAAGSNGERFRSDVLTFPSCANLFGEKGA